MTTASSALLELRAGPGALAHLRAHGLAPADVACIPAAAGGPKGLALVPLDRLLFREWLDRSAEVELVGASVGAWRMAALEQKTAVAREKIASEAQLKREQMAAEFELRRYQIDRELETRAVELGGKSV